MPPTRSTPPSPPRATTATIGTFSDPATNNIATTLGIVTTSGAKIERLNHVAAADGITMADKHGSAYDITALSATISSAPSLPA